MDILEVKDLTVNVEGKPILKGVTFSLKSGESHILFGPNGSGKTTLISALMGLPTYEPTSGTILFNGTDIITKTVEERAKLGMAVSFQNPPEITGVKRARFKHFRLVNPPTKRTPLLRAQCICYCLALRSSFQEPIRTLCLL